MASARRYLCIKKHISIDFGHEVLNCRWVIKTREVPPCCACSHY